MNRVGSWWNPLEIGQRDGPLTIGLARVPRGRKHLVDLVHRQALLRLALEGDDRPAAGSDAPHDRAIRAQRDAGVSFAPAREGQPPGENDCPSYDAGEC